VPEPAPAPARQLELGTADLDELFEIAEAAIMRGLRGGTPRQPRADELPGPLRQPVNAFVTLVVDGALNGCIGGIDGKQPLGAAVAHHAWAAAFTDPRLPALRPADYEHLVIEISLLSPLEPLAARTREELLAGLRPHVDGLVLETGARRGLFLPVVWEQLLDRGDFVDHLLLKAGLPARSWPPSIAAWRFTAMRYSRRAGARSSSVT
jgi:AmmeMemoRadiSam system protein A